MDFAFQNNLLALENQFGVMQLQQPQAGLKGFRRRNVTESQYSQVLVLLLSWDDNYRDDILGVWNDITRLAHVFKDEYGFAVDWFRIPMTNSYTALEERLSQYKRLCAMSNSLLIVYYGGHSGCNRNMRLILSAQGPLELARRVPPPSLDWGSLQSGLECMKADVLIILDSCETAAAITSAQHDNSNGRTEVIAGSGYPGKSYGFAKHLIPALHRGSQLPFGLTVSSLYRDVLEGVIQQNHVEKKLDVYEPATPVHFSFSNFNAPSIVLKSRKRRNWPYPLPRPNLPLSWSTFESEPEPDEMDALGWNEPIDQQMLLYPHLPQALLNLRPRMRGSNESKRRTKQGNIYS